jgi:hypothetical protein
MPDAIGKPKNFEAMNFPERGSAATAVPPRKRRWWMAAIVVGVLTLGAVAAAAYWYLQVCGNCGPILCDDPCTLPTFGQMQVRPNTDA